MRLRLLRLLRRLPGLHLRPASQPRRRRRGLLWRRPGLRPQPPSRLGRSRARLRLPRLPPPRPPPRPRSQQRRRLSRRRRRGSPRRQRQPGERARCLWVMRCRAQLPASLAGLPCSWLKIKVCARRPPNTPARGRTVPRGAGWLAKKQYQLGPVAQRPACWRPAGPARRRCLQRRLPPGSPRLTGPQRRRGRGSGWQR